jgi:hypothetical protein
MLTVSASVPGAIVSVDGKRIGVAPVELNVAEGAHKVVVAHPDHRLYETSAVVPLGGSKAVVAALQKPSVLARPWFWGTVGAVVVAGAAIGITVALLKERPPDTGTIPPGQIGTRGLSGAPALRF